jgi:hypothetical protein
MKSVIIAQHNCWSHQPSVTTIAAHNITATAYCCCANNNVQVARAAAQQALSWNESDDSGVTSAKGGLKIVVIENMFEPADFENPDDPTFGEDLHNDIAAEVCVTVLYCTVYCTVCLYGRLLIVSIVCV